MQLHYITKLMPQGVHLHGKFHAFFKSAHLLDYAALLILFNSTKLVQVNNALPNLYAWVEGSLKDITYIYQ